MENLCPLLIHFFQYFIGKRLQRSRFTLATGIKDLFLEGLKGFYKRANGKKPERIIVYRNGASEGELQAVAKLEVGQMKAAFAALPGNYRYIFLSVFAVTEYLAQNWRLLW